MEKNLGPNTAHYKAPVPVNLTINMVILTKLQTDMEQIISNFIPFTNPYVVVSWTVPKKYNLPYINEIRSEVLWNGNVSMTYPTDTDANAKYRIMGETQFTIKGWLFSNFTEKINNIFKIDTDITAVPGIANFLSSEYTELTGLKSYYDTESFTVSGIPSVTDVYGYSVR